MPAPLTEAKLTEVYRETVDVLYGYASRRCGGVRQLAEDVTQETWLRAVREWRRTGLPDRPIAWLTTVARNLILNHLRRQEPVPLEAVPAALVDAALDADDALDSADVARTVNAALARMPEHEARLLEAFHFERRRMAQLAESLGISERAVEGRLRRARERLRTELERDGVPPLKAEGGVS